MKFMIILCFLILGMTARALANPACAVCTVAIGASLEIARKLGIDDTIVGLWTGAMLAILGYWAILWFEKKRWNFTGRNILLMGTSLSTVALIYAKQLAYTPKAIGFLYIDTFLLACLSGAALYALSQKLYKYLKQCNNGHAHFPFEKVVLAMAFLFGASILLNYYPL